MGERLEHVEYYRRKSPSSFALGSALQALPEVFCWLCCFLNTPFTYSSVRKLVKLSAVQFMLNNHTVSPFTCFSSHSKLLRLPLCSWADPLILTPGHTSEVYLCSRCFHRTRWASGKCDLCSISLCSKSALWFWGAVIMWYLSSLKGSCGVFYSTERQLSPERNAGDGWYCCACRQQRALFM